MPARFSWSRQCLASVPFRKKGKRRTSFYLGHSYSRRKASGRLRQHTCPSSQGNGRDRKNRHSSHSWLYSSNGIQTFEMIYKSAAILLGHQLATQSIIHFSIGSEAKTNKKKSAGLGSFASYCCPAESGIKIPAPAPKNFKIS